MSQVYFLKTHNGTVPGLSPFYTTATSRKLKISNGSMVLITGLPLSAYVLICDIIVCQLDSLAVTNLCRSIHICWVDFNALAQRNAYKSTKESINYRGLNGDRPLPPD